MNAQQSSALAGTALGEAVNIIYIRGDPAPKERNGIIMKKNLPKILGIAAVVVLVAVLGVVYFLFSEKPVAGSKAITIEVVNSAAVSTVYDLKTDAEFLRQAMNEAEGLTFSGTESEYGLMVSEVNGETADFSVNGAYWSFYVNDEYCNYGIDTQPVEDGDAFKIVYTIG